MTENRHPPTPDMVAESERVLSAARAAGVPIRLAGGLAVRRRHPAATRPPLARTYGDLDVAFSSRSDRKALSQLMNNLGYRPDEMFNTLNGSQRLYYEHQTSRSHIDVFVDSVRMCHTIEFKDRLLYLDDTLSVTDLLLTKLQVIQLNHKDVLDTLAILHDQELVPGAHDRLDPKYLESLWSEDWALWRTCQLTLGKVRELASTVLAGDGLARVNRTLDALESLLLTGNKSVRWKLRARVGDRVRWYQLPDELQG
jgi:hypothetical protein